MSQSKPLQPYYKLRKKMSKKIKSALKSLERKFYSTIWNTSEFLGIGLGKSAPFVFGKTIGSKPIEVDDLGRILSKIIK